MPKRRYLPFRNHFSLSDVINVVNETQFVVVQSINVRSFDIPFIRFVPPNDGGFARAEQRVGNEEIESETKSGGVDREKHSAKTSEGKRTLPGTER